MKLTLRKFEEKINIDGIVARNEPMSGHTTFRVGGPADCYVRPVTVEETLVVLNAAAEYDLPLFVLGGGANILVSDRGIRGVVLDMSGLNTISVAEKSSADEVLFSAGAGLPVSDATSAAAERGLGGMDFLYSMPGSVGGAVWMNARCYGAEVSEVLAYVDYIDENREVKRYRTRADDWAYKVSPFQNRKTAIVGAGFNLHKADSTRLWARMREIRADREAKGHFAAPCAGSVFKNDRRFGAPSGRLIDSIGMRGKQIGGAKVSDLHANIIVNTGNATAADIKGLMDLVQQSVYTRLGMLLEPEVLLVGEWE